MVRTIICAPRRSFIGVAWYTRAFRHVNGSAFSFCLIVCAPRRPFIGVAWCARLFVHRDERLSASHGAQEPSAPWSVQHFCFPKCVCTATIVYRRRMVHVAFHHLGRFCFLVVLFTGRFYTLSLFVHRDDRVAASHGAQVPSAMWSVQHFLFS